jgi:hypothetical protein
MEQLSLHYSLPPGMTTCMIGLVDEAHSSVLLHVVVPWAGRVELVSSSFPESSPRNAGRRLGGMDRRCWLNFTVPPTV